MTTISRIQDVISETFGVSREKLEPDSRLDDLGIDSLPVVAMFFEIEKEFDVTLTLDDRTTLKGLAEAVDRAK